MKDKLMLCDAAIDETTVSHPADASQVAPAEKA